VCNTDTFSTKLSAFKLKGFRYLFALCMSIGSSRDWWCCYLQATLAARLATPWQPYTHPQWHATTHLFPTYPPSSHPTYTEHVPHTPSFQTLFRILPPNLFTSSSSFSVVKHKKRISEFICFLDLSFSHYSLVSAWILICMSFTFYSEMCNTKATSTEISNKTWKKCCVSYFSRSNCGIDRTWPNSIRQCCEMFSVTT
jgi:hypothetical protein